MNAAQQPYSHTRQEEGDDENGDIDPCVDYVCNSYDCSYEDRHPMVCNCDLFNSESKDFFDFMYGTTSDDNRGFQKDFLHRPTVQVLLELLSNTNSKNSNAGETTIPYGRFLSELVFRRSVLTVTPCFTDCELDAIADAARKNTVITELKGLRMECYPRGRSYLQKFWEAIGQLPNLQSVSVTYFRRPTDVHDVMPNPNTWWDNGPDAHNKICYGSLKALLSSSSISSLDIFHCDIVFPWHPYVVAVIDDVDVLTSAISGLSNTLNTLHLRNVFFDDLFVDLKIFRTIMNSLPLLQYLRVSSRVFERGLSVFRPTKILRLPSSLESSSLSLSSSSLTLTELRVLSFDGVRIDDVKRLTNLIIANRSLVKLEFEDCMFDLRSGKGLGQLAKAVTFHPTLEMLGNDLPFSNPYPGQRRVFCKTLAKGLRRNKILRFVDHAVTKYDNEPPAGDSNDVPGSHKCEVLDAFYANRSLKRMSLSCNEDTELSLGYFKQLSSILRRGKTAALYRFELRCKSDIPDGACAFLRESLAYEHSRIEEFNLLSYAEDPPVGFLELPFAANTNQRLRGIRLGHRRLERYGYAETMTVLQGLAGNTTLERLSIIEMRSVCEVTDKLNDIQRHAIFDAVRNMYILHKLNIDIIDSDPVCTAMVRPILELNKHGRWYMIENCGKTNTIERGVDVLVSVVNDLDCLFIHIRENLEFFFPGNCGVSDGDDGDDDDKDVKIKRPSNAIEIMTETAKNPGIVSPAAIAVASSLQISEESPAGANQANQVVIAKRSLPTTEAEGRNTGTKTTLAKRPRLDDS